MPSLPAEKKSVNCGQGPAYDPYIAAMAGVALALSNTLTCRAWCLLLGTMSGCLMRSTVPGSGPVPRPVATISPRWSAVGWSRRMHHGGEGVTVMMAPFFFVLGLVNSVCLIIVFVLRRRRLDLVQRFGWL